MNDKQKLNALKHVYHTPTEMMATGRAGIVQGLLAQESLPTYKIAEKSGFSHTEIISALTRLEHEGKVYKQGNRWHLGDLP